MILGTGIDTIDIRRIERTLGRFGERFTHRIYTELERNRAERRPHQRAATYAKRFAAKEATAKALGTGLKRGVFWRDMGVANLKSGQPTMIQVATPYIGKGIPTTTSESEDDQAQVAEALDWWVEKIKAKYPDQQATWSAAADGAAPVQTGTPQQNGKVLRLMSLLQRGLRKELENLEEGNGAGKAVVAKFLQLGPGSWNNEQTLMDLLKEVWVKEKKASGLPEEVIQVTFSVMDDESILLDLEASLPTDGEG